MSRTLDSSGKPDGKNGMCRCCCTKSIESPFTQRPMSIICHEKLTTVRSPSHCFFFFFFLIWSCRAPCHLQAKLRWLSRRVGKKRTVFGRWFLFEAKETAATQHSAHQIVQPEIEKITATRGAAAADEHELTCAFTSQLEVSNSSREFHYELVTLLRPEKQEAPRANLGSRGPVPEQYKSAELRWYHVQCVARECESKRARAQDRRDDIFAVSPWLLSANESQTRDGLRCIPRVCQLEVLV